MNLPSKTAWSISKKSYSNNSQSIDANKSPEESLTRIRSEIEALKKEGPALHPGDRYQSEVYNRETTLAFLKEAFKK